MKQVTSGLVLKSVLTFLFLCFVQAAIWAQDSGTETSSTTSSKTEIQISDNGDNWYASPWVWAAGAAVFILLLVALTRGGGGSRRSADATSTNRVTVTKTVRRDTDVDTDV